MAGVIDLATYRATIELDDKGFDSGMSEAEGKLEGFKGKAGKLTSFLKTSVVAGIAAVGVAVGAAFVSGIKASDELQQAMNGLQTATGAADDEMKRMEQSLKNIYASDVGESFDDIAQAMATVKQNTGLAGEELEKTTKNALMLRDTFEFDVTESTNAANSLMKQFGISADDAFNLIAQGAQNGANKNGDLTDSLNEYAPQFKALGFSAEEFTNVLIDGANNGAFSVDKVGDAIKELNIRSKDLSTTSFAAYEQLGLNGEEMSEQFSKGGETARKAFQQVVTALNSVDDPLKKNAIGVGLFGTQFEDLEAGAISAFANIGTSADLSKDSLSDIGKVKYDSLGQALTGIGRNFQLSLIEPMQQYVLPLLSQLAQWITEHMPQIQAVMSTVFGFIGQLFNGLIESVQLVIGSFQSAEGSTGSIFSSIQSIISSVVEAIMSIVNDFVVLFKDIWSKYGEDIMKYAKSTWDNISKVISGVMDIIRGIIKTITSLIRGDWKGAWEGIQLIVSGIWKAIEGIVKQALNIIQTVLKAAGTILKNIATTIFNLFLEGVKYVWNKITDYIKEGMDKAIQFYSGVGTRLYNVGKGMFEYLWNGIKDVWNNISSWVSDKVNWLADKLNFWKKGKSEISEDSSSKSNVSVPSYDVGTPFVPKDGLAMIHKGEAIIPAQINPFNGNNQSSTMTQTNSITLQMNVDAKNGWSDKDSKRAVESIFNAISEKQKILGVNSSLVY